MAAANNFPTISLIASESLEHLQEALIIKPLCATDVTGEFNRMSGGYKVGSSIQFNTNPSYEVKTFDERSNDLSWVRDDNKTISAQDIRSSQRTMYIEKHYDVSVTLSARELAMDFNSFSIQVLKPAMRSLSSKIDTYLGQKILTAQGLYAGTSVLATQADMALARKAAIIQELTDDKYCLVDPTLEATLLGASWFNSTTNRVSDAGLTAGMLNRTMGLDFYTSSNFPNTTHLNSSGAAVTVTTPTTTQNKVGTSILYVTDATTELLAGDRIIVAGHKRPMIVKTAVTAEATEIHLVDPITELVPVTTAITLVGGDAKTLTPRGAIFDSQSLGIAMPRLDAASGMENEVISENGVSIRVVKGYNMSTKVTTLSMDCLVGAAAIDPRRITLLANAA